MCQVLLENLIKDLESSLRTCRRELAVSSCVDDDDDDDGDVELSVSQSSMHQLLVDLHTEAMGETEVERRNEMISIRSKQLSITKSCVKACRKLVEQNVTFKSSKEKKNSMLRFFPTNLHVQRLFLHDLCHYEKKEDVDGKEEENEDIGSRIIRMSDPLNMLRNNTSTISCKKYHIFRSLQDMIATSNACYETITLGAGSDHAAKFKFGGIRQMYVVFERFSFLIHLLRGLARITYTTLTLLTLSYPSLAIIPREYSITNTQTQVRAEKRKET